MQNHETLLNQLQEHDAWLRTLALRLVSDRHGAEDVVQETWVAALRGSPREPGSSRPWLATVARNFARMRGRSEAARSSRELAAARRESVPSVDELQIREETRSRVARAVFELDEPYRTAIVYRYLEGLRPAAIARRLGVSAAAIERRLHRGLQMLRVRLDREFGARHTWGGALVPFLPTAGASSVATAGVASTLAGGLSMGTKLKVIVAVVAVFGAVGVVGALRPERTDGPGRFVVPRGDVRSDSRPTGGGASDHPAPDSSAPGRPEPGLDPPVASKIGAAPRLALRGTVRDLQGAPLIGAAVTAFRHREVSPLSERQVEIAMKTDCDGRFGCPEHDARHTWYQVEVHAPGYFLERRRVRVGDETDFTLGPGGTLRGRLTVADSGEPCAGATVALLGSDVVARQAVSDVDGLFRIEDVKPATYEVRVTPVANPVVADVLATVHAGGETVSDVEVPAGFAVRGRVLDQDTNAPIAGAIVEARSRLRRREAVADRIGRYSFDGLAAGASLVASHPDYVERAGSPHRPDDPRQPRAHDFRLYRTSGTVSGRVIDADGAPVAGAGINDSGDGPRAKPRVRSAEDGRFTLPNVVVGRERRIIARKSGFTRAITEPFLLGAREARDGLVLRLGRGAVVAGRVVDPAGAVIASAVVLATPRAALTSERRIRVGEDGTFRFTVLPEGPCQIRAVRSGYLGRQYADLLLVDGGTHEGVTLTLDRGLTLSGRVVDGNGDPVSGARVQASPSQRSSGAFGGGGTGLTGVDGGFAISALAPGTLRVFAHKAGYVQQPSGFVIATPGDRNLRLTLHESRAIHGWVRHDDSGSPARRFFVRAYSSNRVSEAAFSSPEGRFRLEGYDWETYHLEAGTPDGRVSDELVSVTLEPGRDAGPIVLRIAPGAHVHGRVVAPDGLPLEHARIYVRRAGKELTGCLHESSTNRDGEFDMVGLPPADLLFRFHHNDWITVTKRVRLSSGATRDLDAMLEATGGGVEVIVTDRDGLAIPDARLLLQGPDGNSHFPIAARHRASFSREHPAASTSAFGEYLQSLSRTDAHGRRLRRFLPEGPCIVKVTKPGYRAGRTRVTVHLGAKVRAEVTLERLR